MIGSHPPVLGRHTLISVMLVGFASAAAQASFLSTNPSWVGPDRGLSQIGTIPTFEIPASPGSFPTQVTFGNFNLNITNSTFASTPTPGQPQMALDVEFVSTLNVDLRRNGTTEHWSIDGQQIFGTVQTLDAWQGDGAFRRIKAEMYCERLPVRRYNQDWVFAGILASAIRISPDRPSEGFVTSELIAPGQYRISGFFDVFLEVSLDEGASWHALPSPIRWQVVPTPATATVIGFGALLATRRRR